MVEKWQPWVSGSKRRVEPLVTESSHMVGIRSSYDPVLIPFSSFSPFSILGGPHYFLEQR